jgi:glycosyltransferase involved in cell wall biosynthesis
MQRAVVAPAMDNLRDIVDQGVTGLLFTPRDSQSLYRTLHRLLIDANLREALGRNARSRIVEHLNWISNARSIIENAKAIWRNP